MSCCIYLVEDLDGRNVFFWRFVNARFHGGIKNTRCINSNAAETATMKKRDSHERKQGVTLLCVCIFMITSTFLEMENKKKKKKKLHPLSI